MKKMILILTAIFTLILPSFADARGFSGHSSFGHSSFGGFHSSSVRSGGTYHSGYRSPSSSVSRTPSYSHSTPSYSQPSRTGSFMSHAAAFGAGAFLGHMLHPFGGGYYGGGYGYGGSGFSFLGLLIDILVVVIIIKIIKSIFTRRRY